MPSSHAAPNAVEPVLLRRACAYLKPGEAGDVPARILERLAVGVSERRKELAAIGQASACFDTEVLAQAVVGIWARVIVWWAEDPSRATRDDLVKTLTHFQMHRSGGQTMDTCGQSPSEEA